MAADPKFSYTAVNAALDAISTALNGGKLRIYDSASAPPTNADDSIGSDKLLAELTLNADFAPAAGSGQLVANAITTDSSANDTGTADYFRLWDSAGTTCYFQGTVGVATSDLILNSVAITTGAAVAVTGLTLTLPRE
jgi:hypothetical protein